jgi:hypothetical protein
MARRVCMYLHRTSDCRASDTLDLLGIELKAPWEKYFYIKKEKQHRIEMLR